MAKSRPIIVDGKKYVPIKTVVECYDVTRSTVSRHMNDGSLPYYTKPNGYRLPLEEALPDHFALRNASGDQEFAAMMAAARKLAVDDPPLSIEQRAKISPLIAQAQARLSETRPEARAS